MDNFKHKPLDTLKQEEYYKGTIKERINEMISEYDLQYEALESMGLEPDEIERAIEDYNESMGL